MKKLNLKKLAPVFAALAIMAYSSQNAFAVGTSYFELPVGFVDNIIATVLVVAGGLLTITGLKYAWGLTKSMFASR